MVTIAGCQSIYKKYQSQWRRHTFDDIIPHIGYKQYTLLIKTAQR